MCYRKSKDDVAGGKYSRAGRVACTPVRDSSNTIDDDDDDDDSSDGDNDNSSSISSNNTSSMATARNNTRGSSSNPFEEAQEEEEKDLVVVLDVGGSPFPGGDDIHGPYQHGGMFPAVNGGGNMFPPPAVVDVQPAYAVGASQPG